MISRIVLLGLATVALALTAGLPLATAQAKADTRTGRPLAGLPSAPGPHLAKIKGLTDDSTADGTVWVYHYKGRVQP